jgi:hypothetical protein
MENNNKCQWNKAFVWGEPRGVNHLFFGLFCPVLLLGKAKQQHRAIYRYQNFYQEMIYEKLVFQEQT